jgi:inosose dehydratase
MAGDYGVKILLEPHGRITDSVPLMQRVIDKCESEALGVNLDTGNLWLGGGDPLEFIDRFGDKIEHVHWKDLGEEFVAQRGKLFGCGMSIIPLGTGVIGIEKIYHALVESGFDGYSTLEIAGEEAVRGSFDFLRSLGAE